MNGSVLRSPHRRTTFSYVLIVKDRAATKISSGSPLGSCSSGVALVSPCLARASAVWFERSLRKKCDSLPYPSSAQVSGMAVLYLETAVSGGQVSTRGEELTQSLAIAWLLAQYVRQGGLNIPLWLNLTDPCAFWRRVCHGP